MVVFGIVCHYIGILCGHYKQENNVVWPQTSVKFTSSYLAASGQLLAYVTDALKDASTASNTTDLWSPHKNISTILSEDISKEEVANIMSFNNEDKLAVAQIFEKTLTESETEFFRLSVKWNSDEKGINEETSQTKPDISELLKDINMKNTFRKVIIENQPESTSDTFWSINYDKNNVFDKKFAADIFQNGPQIDKLENDPNFNNIIESLGEESSRDRIYKRIDPSLMFDEILHLLEYVKEFLENIEINSKIVPETIGFESRVRVSDLLKLLTISSYKSLTINSFYRNDAENDVVNIDSLVDSLKNYENQIAVDELTVPLKLKGNLVEKPFNLSSLVNAILKEERKSDTNEFIPPTLNFNIVPNDMNMVSIRSKTLRQFDRYKPKIENEELVEDSVQFILSKLRDLLATEAKVRSLHSLQGYSHDLFTDLSSTIFNSSAQQLHYSLDHMIKNNNSVWTPPLMLSAFIVDELESKDSDITSTLNDIKPLKYS